MTNKNPGVLRRWRAPKWAPVWFRRMFPGVWTQAEIDGIRQRARAEAAEFEKYVD